MIPKIWIQSAVLFSHLPKVDETKKMSPYDVFS